MKAILFATAVAACIAGCMTNPKIESTKPWEGHYYSVEEVKQQLDLMELGKDESVWIVSNHTLYRLLKNTRK